MNRAPTIGAILFTLLDCGGVAETELDASAPQDDAAHGHLCVPGESIACEGPNGCSGHQVCAPNGEEYRPCICGVPQDGSFTDGTIVDGGRDAATDALIVDADADAPVADSPADVTDSAVDSQPDVTSVDASPDSASVCDAISCKNGCCQGSTCIPYASQTDLECGSEGSACGSCVAPKTCGAGAPGYCGCTPITLAIAQDGALGVAVDATSVYWTDNTSQGRVMKIPVGGGSPTTLASAQTNPWFCVAVDATSVYWTDYDNNSTVMRVPVGGGTPTALASAQNEPQCVAVDATSVYWTTYSLLGAVKKAPLGGGSPVTLATGQKFPSWVVSDLTSVYWVTVGDVQIVAGDGTVMKVPVAGGSATTLAFGQNAPRAVAVDGTNVYWTNGGTSMAPLGSVMKVPIAGGTPTTLAAGNNLAPLGIAIDATRVYFTAYAGGNVASGLIMSVPIAGGNPIVHATGQWGVQTIALDATSIYWTTGENPGGTVRKVCK